jgi:hypothetical protein
MTLFLRCLKVFFFGVVCSLALAEEINKLPPMHHPVAIQLPDSMSIPEELQLGEQQELICDTCHGVKDLKDIPLDEVDTDVPDFLHGGPYQDLTDFCYRCHEESESERNNLHVMLDESGELITKNCLYCHIETPDPTEKNDLDEMEFRIAKEKLCYGCHLKTPHLNAHSHQMEPSKEMREKMVESKKKYHVILPLVEDGKVGCITCHTPHQAGVINKESPAGRQVEDQSVAEGIAYKRTSWSQVFSKDKEKRLEEMIGMHDRAGEIPEYQRIEKEILIRLPAKDGTLCLSCHNFED